MKDAYYFSTIDLAQGYMQVPLAPEDREKTVFFVPQLAFGKGQECSSAVVQQHGAI